MDGFRFILENPHPNATNNKQRKRARLVTACDSCRVKKIRCQQSTPNSRCEACKNAKIACLFGDRDRYQAERGVTCTWSTAIEESPASPPDNTTSRKRKLASSTTPPATASWPRPSDSVSTAGSSSATASAPATPPQSYPYLPAGQANRMVPASASTAYVNEFSVFSRNATLISLDRVPADMASSSYHNTLPLFDPSRPRLPHPLRMRQLGVLFFDTLGSHFPFLDRSEVLHRIEQRTCSPILSNCIAGLALRFSNMADSAAATQYYDTAKTLAAHVVSVPSVEALHALICITQTEYGALNDSGFWMYSRMAISMCLDLGLGNESAIPAAASLEVQNRLRLTWWTVVCLADIAASWATGQPTTLDLEQFDTKLPVVTDDRSLLLNNVIQLFVLRGKINRVLDSHIKNQGDSSLDWSLSELQSELSSMSKNLPNSLAFNETNIARIQQEGQFGHAFVHMHLLIHSLTALVNRPSLLPAYGLPVPREGPRADAARSSAKSLVHVIMAAQDVAPSAVSDPFMDLSIVIACRTFIAEAEAANDRSSSSEVAKQWSETFLGKCKESLMRLSSVCGGSASFDTILTQHGGTLVDDLQLSSGNHSSDQFTASDSIRWLLKPSLVDDSASDTSSSFRSSSRELSPYFTPPSSSNSSSARSTTPGTFHSSLEGSPVLATADRSTTTTTTNEHVDFLNAADFTFNPSDIFATAGGLDSLGAGGGSEMFSLASYLEPGTLQLSIESAEAHRFLNLDLYSSRKELLSAGDKQSPAGGLFSPLPWLTRT